MQVLKRTGFKKIIVIKSEMKSTCSFNLYVEQPLLLDNSKLTCVTFAAYHVTLCSLYYLQSQVLASLLYKAERDTERESSMEILFA